MIKLSIHFFRNSPYLYLAVTAFISYNIVLRPITFV